MSKIEELQAWEARAKREGLVDVKFYPGPRRETNLEAAAAAALTLLAGSPYEEDVSEDNL